MTPDAAAPVPSRTVSDASSAGATRSAIDFAMRWRSGWPGDTSMMVLFVIWNRSDTLTVAEVGHGIIEGWVIACCSPFTGAAGGALAAVTAFGCVHTPSAIAVASADAT